LRRAWHAGIQSRLGRAPRQRCEGIFGGTGHCDGPSRHHLLWQGAARLHRIQRTVLGAEPARGHNHHCRSSNLLMPERPCSRHGRAT
jgi:hypothetical protein